MRRHCNFIAVLCIVTTVSLANISTSSGQASDSKQVVMVTANHSEYSEKLQRQTLTGDVVIKQGSLLINADNVIIYLKAGVLDSIDASGTPARYQQLDDAGQLVKGKSNKVDYSAISGELILIGEATLTNPKQSLSGERITYNVTTQAAAASGGDKPVNIIIQPAESAAQ